MSSKTTLSLLSSTRHTITILFLVLLAISLFPPSLAADSTNSDVSHGDVTRGDAASGDVTHLRCSSTTVGCRCHRMDNSAVANCSAIDSMTSSITYPSWARTLILDENGFTELSDTFFDVGVNSSALLEILSLVRNNISVISEKAFSRLAGLKELRLDHNRIEVLPAKVFDCNNQLQVLSLANNPLNLSSIVESLKRLTTLEKLDLSKSGDAFYGLPDGFANLTSLNDLVIRDVIIHNLTADFFAALTDVQLRKLDLSLSVIHTVDPEALKPLAQNLQELSLANTVLTKHDAENLLTGLANSSLEALDLSDVFVVKNHEYDIPVHIFRHLEHSQLKTLRFQGNYAGLHGSRLHDRLFQPLKNLRYLFVDRCDLMSAGPDAFRGLQHLHTLSMSENRLSCIRGSDCRFLTGGFQLKILQMLDLSDNLLSEAEGAVRFTDAVFPHLLHLNLRRNRLQTIAPPMFGLAKLTTLDLSENPITEIAADAFRELPALRKLSIEGCPQLSRLRMNTFSGLLALKILNLQNSGLVHIHHAVFNHMAHLEELNLRNNQLGQGTDSRASVEKLTIRKSNLKVLDLGRNGISVAPTGILENSYDLKWLNLDDNRFSDCRQLKSLAGTEIKYIDLSYNHIVEPSVDCFNGMGSLVSLGMAGNPFACTCAIREFSDWLVKKKLVADETSEYVCVTPSSRLGSEMFDVKYSHWECGGKVALMTVSIVLGFMGLLVGGILFGLRRRNCCSRAAGGGLACNSNQHSTAISSLSGEGSRSFNSTVMTESGTRYSPLEEEEAPAFGESSPDVSVANGYHHRHDNNGGGYQTAHPNTVVAVSNGHCIPASNGDVTHVSIHAPPPSVKGVSNRARRSAAAGVNQGRALSSRDTSARHGLDDLDNNAMLLTSDLQDGNWANSDAVAQLEDDAL